MRGGYHVDRNKLFDFEISTFAMILILMSVPKNMILQNISSEFNHIHLFKPTRENYTHKKIILY